MVVATPTATSIPIEKATREPANETPTSATPIATPRDHDPRRYPTPSDQQQSEPAGDNSTHSEGRVEVSGERLGLSQQFDGDDYHQYVERSDDEVARGEGENHDPRTACQQLRDAGDDRVRVLLRRGAPSR